MKAPDLRELAEVKEKDPLRVAIRQEQEAAQKHIKVSYTVLPRHLDYINRFTLELSNKAGKPIKASEALRIILDRDMEANK